MMTTAHLGAAGVLLAVLIASVSISTLSVTPAAAWVPCGTTVDGCGNDTGPPPPEVRIPHGDPSQSDPPYYPAPPPAAPEPTSVALPSPGIGSPLASGTASLPTADPASSGEGDPLAAGITPGGGQGLWPEGTEEAALDEYIAKIKSNPGWEQHQWGTWTRDDFRRDMNGQRANALTIANNIEKMLDRVSDPAKRAAYEQHVAELRQWGIPKGKGSPTTPSKFSLLPPEDRPQPLVFPIPEESTWQETLPLPSEVGSSVAEIFPNYQPDTLTTTAFPFPPLPPESPRLLPGPSLAPSLDLSDFLTPVRVTCFVAYFPSPWPWWQPPTC